ncbi:MAG: trypsin-like peptidase domain-containing protein [Egibacteraceae bacterium]
MTEDPVRYATAPLRLPSPPRPAGGTATTYPTIPAGPGGFRRPDPRPASPRLAAVAMLAALVGALLGSGAMIAYTDQRSTDAPVSAQPVRGGGEVFAPTLDIEGADGVDRVAGIAAAVIPTVVQVDIEGGGPLGQGAGNGSGVVYRSDGHILTNNHVVDGADAVEVVLSDGTRLDATVVGTDPANDLAVLHVDRADLTAIQVGDSSDLRIGELAVAIGSPFGLEGTVTSGVVSALNRDIPVGGPNRMPMTMFNVIQTDAPINPGNSGGPLVGGDARLIGINSAILTTGGAPGNAGVGFAIPADTAVAIADELIERGFVRHPLLGVQGGDLSDELAERLGVDEGAYVQEVQPGTPAEEAGLQADDVIVAVDDVPITSMTDLVIEVRGKSVGEQVTVTYIRNAEEQRAEVALAERPRDQ